MLNEAHNRAFWRFLTGQKTRLILQDVVCQRIRKTLKFGSTLTRVCLNGNTPLTADTLSDNFIIIFEEACPCDSKKVDDLLPRSVCIRVIQRVHIGASSLLAWLDKNRPYLCTRICVRLIKNTMKEESLLPLS